MEMSINDLDKRVMARFDHNKTMEYAELIGKVADKYKCVTVEHKKVVYADSYIMPDDVKQKK